MVPGSNFLLRHRVTTSRDTLFDTELGEFVIHQVDVDEECFESGSSRRFEKFEL